jgi:hypothetical protein
VHLKRGTVTDHDDDTPNDDTPNGDESDEPVARGLLAAWAAAKFTPWLVRITSWAIRLGVVVAYAAYVAWRVRRAVRAGALDDATDRPSEIAREEGVMAWVRRAH